MKPFYFFLFLSLALTGCARTTAPTEQPSVPPTQISTKAPVPTATATSQFTTLASDKPRLAPAASSEDIAALAFGNNAFAFDLYHAIAGGEDNLLFSPYSLSQALAMVYAGARAGTAQEMADTLHFSLPPERLHPAFNALDLDLRGRSSPSPESKSGKEGQEIGFELNIANAVWGQQSYPYQSEFLDLLAQNYGAGLQLVDFEKHASEATAAINRWVSEQTNGRIQNIVNKIDESTKLVLANAVYFNAGWAEPFDETNTRPEPFYLLDGQAKEAPMMHQQNNFFYTEGEDFQAILLPYVNHDFGMAIILPKEEQFREIEEQLTGQWVQEIWQEFQEYEVILSMPKFRFETPGIQLGNSLSEMGMPSVFSSKADFSGITDRQLAIGNVLHKAFIQVDEKKTEAAAVSVEEYMELAAMPETTKTVEMRIDRPFVFLIRDNRTNTNLFVGRVMDPTQ